MIINHIKKWIEYFSKPRYQLEDVFTPAKAAEINYVERFLIDSRLKSEMSTPGKQIIVFGDSGSGKTSSVRNLLLKNKSKFIKTHCESFTTFEQLILNAFDELNAFVVSEKEQKQSACIKGEFAADYNFIKASITEEITSEENKTYTRLLPPQLTPQKLAKFMGAGNIVWLIEDFHKVSTTEKKRIADVLKIFVDNANDYPLSKIICIGTCQSAHELIQLDPNLRTRVSEVSIPLLTDDEIKSIIINGFSLLNILPSSSLVDKLVYYSDRLGATAHQMCMDICKKEKINQTQKKERQIQDDTFQHAVDGFIKSSEDTFKSIYEAAVKNELGWYILKSFSAKNNNKLSFDEIVKRVNAKNRHFENTIIKDNLDKLMDPNFNIIYYNHNSDMYSLSSPFWHHYLKLQHSIEIAEKRKKKKDKLNKNLKLNDLNLNFNKQDVVDQSFYKWIEELVKNIEGDIEGDIERLNSLDKNNIE